MRVVVCIKQVSVLTGPLLIGRDQRLAAASLTPAVNPNDHFAFEEALRLREQGTASEIVTVTVGSEDLGGTVTWCHASGANRVLRLQAAELAALDAFGIGRVLARVISRLDAQLVLCGQRSTDTGTGLVPVAIAAALGVPYVSEAAKLRFADGNLIVERKLERGARAVWRAPTPAVVGCAPNINVPRYVPIAKQVLALRAQAEDLVWTDLALDPAALQPRVTLRGLMPARLRPKRTGTSTVGMTTADKMRLIMSGGVSEKKEKKIIRGDAETLAREFLAFLQEHEFINPPPVTSNGKSQQR